MKAPLILDIEAVGEPWDGRLLCIGFQVLGEDHPEVAFPGEFDGTLDVREMLADPGRPTVTFTKYDARWLRLAGWEVNGPIYDVQVMAWVLNENTPLSLEYCVRRYCGEEMDKRIRQVANEPMFLCDNGKLVPLAEAPRDQLARYNLGDVQATADLFVVLRSKMQTTEWWDYFLEEEVPFTSVLLDMECTGMPVDLAQSESLREQLEVRATDLAAELHEAAGLPESFNLGSGEQMSRLLFSKVFELTDALRYDEWTTGALKACGKVTPGAECDDCPDEYHLIQLLPAGFMVDSIGRDLVHGRWTLKGLGLKPGVQVPSGDRPSTSTPALLSNNAVRGNEWVEDLLVWRKTTKVLTTYLRSFPRRARNAQGDSYAEVQARLGCSAGELGGSSAVVAQLEDRQSLDLQLSTFRIFGRFNQTGTVTGRLSSSEPNLQNIPAHGELGPQVRALFAGDLIVGDYSQLEPRLMAHFSQDPFLLDVYREGKDIYRSVAGGVFGVSPEDVSDEQRGIGKVLVLSMGYGAGAAKVAQILTINGYPTDPQTAKGYLLELQRLAADFFQWRQDVIALARRKGYVTTIGGRHRRLAGTLKDRTWKTAGYGERQAVNAVVQGSAGDIVRRTMLATAKEFPDLRLLAQVHDELVWGHPEGFFDHDTVWWSDTETYLDHLAHVATAGHGYELSVPLVFEPHIGASWAEAKEGGAVTWVEDIGAEEDVA